MKLEISGLRITRVFKNAFAVDIELDHRHDLGFKLEGEYFVEYQGNVFNMVPEEDDNERVLEVFQPLLDVAIEQAIADDSGELRMTFADGSLLKAHPGDMYEAWSYHGPRRIFVLSLPGGRITSTEPE
jgi:hypothetical protein